MDSQAKYCALARGDGAIYIRMPVQADYREKIWVRIPTLHKVSFPPNRMLSTRTTLRVL